MVRAVVAQRGQGVERPIAVVSPNDRVAVHVITFDPFENSSPHQAIKVRVYWRTAMRQGFSRGSVVSKISVVDIKDLKTAVDQKQPRMFVV